MHEWYASIRACIRARAVVFPIVPVSVPVLRLCARGMAFPIVPGMGGCSRLLKVANIANIANDDSLTHLVNAQQTVHQAHSVDQPFCVRV